MSKKVSLWSVVSRLPAKSLKATISLDSNRILFLFFVSFSRIVRVARRKNKTYTIGKEERDRRLTILTRPEELAALQEDPTDPVSNKTLILFPVDIYMVLQRKSPSLPRRSSSAKLWTIRMTFPSLIQRKERTTGRWVEIKKKERKTTLTGLLDRSESSFQTR